MLYIVPTPIGNLKDITYRAVEVLKEADVIVCEDTRQTPKLLKAYDIEKKPLLSFHEHSKEGRVQEILALLQNEKKVALVSDGGTPLVSDPGFQIVHEALKNGIAVEALPGPSACITALIGSGLAVDRFSFQGFLPPKSGARKRAFEEVADRKETLIYYESPYRLLRMLQDMFAVLGDREVVVAREITKKFEEYVRGTVSELIKRFESKAAIGEIVLLVSGKERKQLLS